MFKVCLKMIFPFFSYLLLEDYKDEEHNQTMYWKILLYNLFPFLVFAFPNGELFTEENMFILN